MPIHFETDAERDALTKAWGDTATTDAGAVVHGQYDEPSADVALMQARAPEFTASLAELEAASVVVGSTFATVSTFSGLTRGPFEVISWDRLPDGNFVTVGLQQL